MKVRVVTFALCVLAAAVYADDLRLISWNLRDANPHSKAKFVADTAREQKADIVAFQAVNVTPYNLILDLTEAFGKGWDYRVTKSAVGPKQLAIFWNTKTVKLKTTKVPNAGAYEETAIQVNEKVNLPAQVAYFQKGMYDFFLLNVDLIRGWEGNEIKLQQVKVLSQWVSTKKKALSGTENDFVVAGSFHFSFPGEKVDDTLMNNPASEILSGQNLLIYTMKEVWVKDPTVFSYVGSWVDDYRLLDGFALSKPAYRHYVKGSSQVLRVDKKFKDLDSYEDDVSSHLPVIIKFKTNFED
ncbi:MAG: hypothetical protein PHV34_19920 [Verrucomicrobiae bacterium]|nr:hypothetical protein [Verrucomicrobiae bacterium]